MYPAGESGISVQYVTLDDGLSIRVLDSGPARRQSVVLVHGWGASVYSFSETLPVLSAAGFRAIAIDLPGHGLSSKPTNDGAYTTRALSNVVMHTANAMGIERFTYVGHSLGGSLGLDLATRGARAVERLVLLNAIGLGRVLPLPLLKLFSPRAVNRITPALLTRRAIDLILRFACAAPGRPTGRDVEEYWAPTQFDEFAWACRACIHHASWARVPATKLRSLRIPVLVIAGGRDLLVRGTLERARLIPGARIVMLRGCGHIIMQECATRTNQELLAFLEAGHRGLSQGIK